MAIFIHSLVKNNFTFISRRNLHFASLTALSTKNTSIAKKLFDEQLKNIPKCTDFNSKFSVAHHIVKTFLSDEKICLEVPIVSKRNEELIDYNIIGGRCQRMKLLLNTYQKLSKSMLTDEQILRSWIMGYLIQMLLGSILIIDDAIDQSATRRNKMTWYKKIGTMDICGHPLVIGIGIQVILKSFISDEPYYLSCIDIFNEAYWETACGSALVSKTTDILGKNQKYCNWETFEILGSAIGASNSFQLPMLAAMSMAEVDYDHVKDDLTKMFSALGCMTFAENHYCDIFGKRSGKELNEDIKFGNFSWFLLKALDHCDYNQRQLLQDCYGKSDPECITAVLKVYEELNVTEKFFVYKRDMKNIVLNCIKNIDDVRFQQPLLDMLYIAENWYNDISL